MNALANLQTPALVLDEAKMNTNIKRLRDRIDRHGVILRPHLKTPKSVEVARRLGAFGHRTATVSTLKEAEIFADAGILDIVYAVGIAPDKLERVVRIRQLGCDLCLVLDSIDQAQAVGAMSRQIGDVIPVMLEIDSDGHRSGLSPGDPSIVEIGRQVVASGAALRGVLTHAGESYHLSDAAALTAMAHQERDGAVRAADALRSAGLPCPVVSVGSTPTAHFAEDLAGVTEVRAGVYMFFDLVMAGVGVCSLDDIALSVLATVIGHQRERGWIITDAGWMAMSRDRGTAAQAIDQGYGTVCDVDGKLFTDLIVGGANQEHGICQLREGSRATLPDLPIGAKLRVLPNHACATAAQYEAYEVIQAAAEQPLARWSRFNGW